MYRHLKHEKFHEEAYPHVDLSARKLLFEFSFWKIEISQVMRDFYEK